MSGIHSEQTATEGIHTPFNWIWADSTERTAQTTVASDLYKIGFQVDTGTIYVCTDPSVPTFVAV